MSKKDSSGVHDRGKDNHHGHLYGAKSHPITPTKVVDAKPNISIVQRARESHHGDNSVKIAPYIPTGGASLIPNKKRGHFGVNHVHDNGKPQRISHRDD
jgi:hypothetical protein